MKIPWEEIEELTKYLKEKGLTEISIETKDGKITIKKDSHGSVTSSVSGGLEVVSKRERASEQAGTKNNLYEVTSPMVGTFYTSSSPGTDPFVQVGSKIKTGDVLCIIEAMKIMNELTSEVSGTVHSIQVKDNQTVEYGEVLMTLETI